MSDPIKPGAPLANGAMSTEGTTTPVKLSKPELDFADKKVLCSAICKCKSTPGIGKDGRSLKQSCVSGQLKALDGILQHRSPYKPEVNYDMTRQPPAPIMDRNVETKGHDWLPGWIKKWWDAPDDQGTQRGSFKAGRGLIRRPDVVIVNDPTRPPTQDNIKQVVEIKFPPDKMNEAQRKAYTLISGDEDKLVELEPSHCDCNQSEPNRSKIPVEHLGTAALVTGIVYMLLTKRPPPGMVPAL
ncbi:MULTISPECIES: VRR-NUC domain-containing protein [Pseudomonas]|uniref:VRR-NUC domain-containing protein n=1 Tax=Pseudomonas TaxID=286 RepID=UPI0001CC2655|nr:MULTISPECIES: VRR-NUC domain-containing protein [Pseudomonas]KEZ67459.1 nuclease [Pseudomonas syringae pv. syringae FF5]MBP1118793.1 hypothetical protein [Pseudomonas sp. PvP028]MBS7417358.1 VRR-NUC domain-containing protein [Pseudomonas syringae]MBS7436511.1 VRR-NUC domain-containing protein [Pseudomonas syringae]MBS7459992.1 VRR-NUC domain-containing protein [Pseudomonas syringae]